MKRMVRRDRGRGRSRSRHFHNLFLYLLGIIKSQYTFFGLIIRVFGVLENVLRNVLRKESYFTYIQ